MVTVPKVTRVADGDRKAIAWGHPAGMDPSRRIASSYQNPDLKHPMRRGGVLGACGCEVRLRPINILHAVAFCRAVFRTDVLNGCGVLRTSHKDIHHAV